MKRISIITPCLNSEHHIRKTVDSVLNQTAVLSGRAELEYLICDGASSDQTLEILLGYSHPGLKVYSNPDSGMYAALAYGLSQVHGDIVAYINAGDFYSPEAFDIVLDLFEQEDIQWLTGYNVHYNSRSQFVQVKLPFRYRREFFRTGLYGRFLIHVQQESTFWAARLHESIDLDKLAHFHYAGDFYLWHCFAELCDLKIVEAYLGGFRIQPGQLSENVAGYQEEMAAISDRPHLYHHVFALFDRIMWYAPVEFKKLLNRSGLFCYDHLKQKWV